MTDVPAVKFSASALLRPGALLVIASNALPIVGVLAWGWDVFLVLLVYWFETVIIAFWTVVRIACLSSTEVSELASGDGQRWRAVPLALFFTAHSGIFIGVHFMFLWTLFAGDWPQRIGGLADFFRVLIAGTGLWIPLAVLFALHGLGFVKEITGQSVTGRLARMLWGGTGDPGAPEPFGAAMLGRLYMRIIAMQFAIILGGMLAVALGSMGPLLILIAIKTVIETAITVSLPPEWTTLAARRGNR